MTTEPFVDLVAKVALVGCVIMIYLLIRHILINPWLVRVFRSLRRSKENPVPGSNPEHRTPLSAHQSVVRPVESRAYRGDEQHSVNDYTQQRERAQQFTILANQLVLMGQRPWAIAPQVDLVTAQTVHMANAMVAISTPAADAAKSGNVYIVSIGKSRIVCETGNEMRELTVALNADTAQVLLPHRLAILRWFTGYPGESLSEKPWTVVSAGSVEAAVAPGADAEGLCRELNDVYDRHTSPIKERLRARLIEMAEDEAAICVAALGTE